MLLGVIGSAGRGLGWLLLVLALPLVFPDGRPPGRRSAWLVAGCVGAFTLGSLIAPVPLEDRLAGTDNPLGVPDSWRSVADLLALGALAAAFVALVVAVRALVLKWRAGGELVRQQVLVFGIAFALPLVVLPVVATPWARAVDVRAGRAAGAGGGGGRDVPAAPVRRAAGRPRHR